MQVTIDLVPGTRVRIIAGTHKGKRGVIGEVKGTGRNSGKVQVTNVGRFNESYWVNPSWVEVESSHQASAAHPEFGVAQKSQSASLWESSAEFTITLKSGQTADVKFNPSLEGQLRMHQFDLTGPVSPTGFKSHFVLATESEGYRTPHDYAQAYAEALIVQLELTTSGRKRSPQEQKAIAALKPVTDKDNSSSSATAAETSISFPNELEFVNCAFVGVTPVPGIHEEDIPVLCEDADYLAPTYQKPQSQFSHTALPLVKDSGSNNPSNQEEATVYSVSGDGVMASETVIDDGQRPEAEGERQATVGGTQSKAIALSQTTSEKADFLDETKAPVTRSPALLNPVPEATGSGTSTVGVLEPLTPEEESERHRLELKVERAFYEAGLALRILRDLRLYRSTHKSWQAYCKDRFGYGRDSADLKISAAGVVENLEKVPTIGRQILPTNERQVRPLTPLEPEEQRQIWKEAVESVGGKVPSGKIIKGILDRRKQRVTTPPAIPQQVGDVVEIRAGSNPDLRKHDGCWGIVTHVGSFSCTVHISVRSVDVQCKPDEMDNVDPKYTADIRAVSTRISALAKHDLDPAVWSILETLSRQTCFTQIQLDLLAWVEERYLVSH